jgi:GT2 family glycosyltransferase
MRRSAYEKVGGYEPEIFMYTEDVELSYRFRSHGYALKYVPSAVVHHYTYESIAQVKPLQYTGSAIGNLYIRLRYGKKSDRLAGWLLYAARFLRPSPFAGAKWQLLKNGYELLPHCAHFLLGKGQESAYFPLHGYDYEMTREGAFWEVQPVPTVDAPLVTVMTRTYKGRGMFLQQVMQSIFNQTYPAIELIVVEDGGNSQQELVNTLAARSPIGCHVRFIANPKLGRSAAGNTALAAATGKYLMFLDDDDLLFADHIETLVAALSRDTGLSAAYALSTEIHTSVAPSGQHYVETAFDTSNRFRQVWDYATLLDHNFIAIQAILFKRELYLQRGGFDSNLDQLEDWNLWLRYGYGNRFIYVPKTTSLFRSPADYDARVGRVSMLHADYYSAKKGAVDDLKRLGLMQ